MNHINQAVSDAKQGYIQWKKRHDLRQGQVWNVDVTCRMIKTATTYILVFELKNLQICSEGINDSLDFTYKIHSEKQELSQAVRYVQRKNSDLSNWATVNERVSSNPQGIGTKFTERETKLLALIAEIFQQQEFFDAENKQKKYEEDKSETFKSESNDEEDDKANVDAEGNKNITNSNSDIDQHTKSSQTATSSTGRSNSVASNADSFKQGGIEENLTGLPNKLYLPKSFKRLRTVALLMITLSMLSTVAVLVYDFIFNSQLTTSIRQEFLMRQLDGLVLKDFVIVQLLFLSFKKGFYSPDFRNSMTPEIDKIERNLTSLVSQVNFADHQIGKSLALEMVVSFDKYSDSKLTVKYTDSVESFRMTFMEVYQTVSNFNRLNLMNAEFGSSGSIEDNEVYYFVFQNVNTIFQKMADHFAWSWSVFLADYTRNLLLILLGSLVLSIGFCGWLLYQLSACYDYLNQTYGLMVGFSASSIKAHRNFIRDLSSLMETKVI